MASTLRGAWLLPALLAGCALPGPNPVASPPASAPATKPSGGASPSAPASTPVASSSAPTGPIGPVGLPLPSRIHLPLPAALTKGLLQGLFPPGEVQALTEAGGGSVAAQGGALVSNNGSSLLSNHGGGWRLAPRPYALRQVSESGDNSATIFELLGLDAASSAVSSSMFIYMFQAINMDGFIKLLGAQRDWKAGEAKAMVFRSTMASGRVQQVMLNVVSGPGPRGPMFWIYDVNDAVKVPGGLRPALPEAVLELKGEGEGRMVWLPRFPTGPRFAMSSSFHLQRQQVLAEAVVQHPTLNTMFRVRWAFSRSEAGFQLRSQSLLQSPKTQGLEGRRKLALTVDEAGQSQFSVQVSQADGSYRWLGEKTAQLLEAPSFLALDGDGLLQGSLPSGPNAADLASRLGFEGLGFLEGEAPTAPASAAEDDPAFALSGTAPEPAPVVRSAEFEALLNAAAQP